MTIEIRSIADVEEIEKTPLEDRLRGETVYDMLRQTAAANAGRVAITALTPGKPLENGRDITFDELLKGVNRSANMFRDLGLQPDQSVTDMLPLVPDGFYVKFAAETVGIANPVNPMLEIDHLDGIARAANSRIILAPGKALNEELYQKAVALAQANIDIHTVLLLGGGNECDGQRGRSLEATLASSIVAN